MTAVMPMPVTAAAGPRPLRWTCAEFHRMGDLGMFEGRRAFLIDGQILEQGPMNPPHVIALGLTQSVLMAVFGPGWVVRNQVPLPLSLETDPMPDFAVVPGSPRDYTVHPRTAELVIEISDTTLRHDAVEKRHLYARAGIREYWVLDLNARVLIVHRDPRGGDYHNVRTLGPTDAVTPLAAHAPITVADLLP